MPGANDPDNRRMMEFDNLNKYQLDVKTNTVSTTYKFAQQPYGLVIWRFSILQVSPNFYIFPKSPYFDDVVYALFNKTVGVVMPLTNIEAGKPYHTNFSSAKKMNTTTMQVKA
ncbi:MAG: hypothetical protein IPI65_16740 [Bacteroidetes bacterium]|nr:hypothetical protein [Bacteroidota bacterium]